LLTRRQTSRAPFRPAKLDAQEIRHDCGTFACGTLAKAPANSSGMAKVIFIAGAYHGQRVVSSRHGINYQPAGASGCGLVGSKHVASARYFIRQNARRFKDVLSCDRLQPAFLGQARATRPSFQRTAASSATRNRYSRATARCAALAGLQIVAVRFFRISIVPFSERIVVMVTAMLRAWNVNQTAKTASVISDLRSGADCGRAL